ncbi:hypothetical protein GYMLUDRAFT_1029162 [Collybiopsis luxurians FD-317 M1]|uniref:Uncharacterized protein n=1 Tax=Collybiopsis luxurians FD-317 M1 TaxID=944289 RepID=A0A0D0CBI1_9AGAR|nr:hypothetical protein GYMLUDRAFT_1029162 [Collybiopsis luxurians FD-317 M1]
MSDISASTINAIIGAFQANNQNAQLHNAILAAIASTQTGGSSSPTSTYCTSCSYSEPLNILHSLPCPLTAVCQTCICPHGLSVAASTGVTAGVTTSAGVMTAPATAFYAVFVGHATGVFSSL